MSTPPSAVSVKRWVSDAELGSHARQMASLDTVQNTHLQLQSLNVVKLHPILWKQCSLEVLYRVQLIKKRIEQLTLWCVYICLMRHLSSDSLPRISLTGSRVSLSLSLSELIVTSSLLCLQRRAPSVKSNSFECGWKPKALSCFSIQLLGLFYTYTHCQLPALSP